MRTSKAAAALGMALSLSLAGAADAQKRYGPGVTDTEIKIGQTMPYSGLLSAYSAIGRAQLAYFAKINAEGGIHGRRITLLSLDDGYSYPRTLELVRRLVEEEGVLLLFSLLGLSPNTAVHRYANEHGVPQLFVADGHSNWADPARFPWTMGWMPPNRLKARLYARHILRTRPSARIGLLYANDDYAHDFAQGFIDGLADRATMIVSRQTYEVTDSTLDTQLHALKTAGVDTLFTAMGRKHAARTIRKMAEIGWHPAHYASVIGTSIRAALEPAGLDNALGLITAEYAKTVDALEWRDDPAVKAYFAWAGKYYDGDPYDGIAAYGYQVAQALEYVLGRCGDDLTRENVMRVVTGLKDVSLPMLLPGVRVNTSPTDYRPIKQLQMLRFNGKGWDLLEELAGL